VKTNVYSPMICVVVTSIKRLMFILDATIRGLPLAGYYSSQLTVGNTCSIQGQLAGSGVAHRFAGTVRFGRRWSEAN
jgi:hypothetical protein